MDVLCIGQIVADVLVKPMQTLDFTLDTQLVDTIQVLPGGDCMNTAVALRMLDNTVGICGKIGYDSMGDMLRNAIFRHGIDAKGLRASSEAATASCLVAIRTDGARAFFYHGGANMTLEASDVSPDWIAECRAVHIGGAYALSGFDGCGAAEVLRLAKEKGKTTSMDVTWDVNGRWLDTIRPCLPHLDFFMPSINEARHITGRDNPRDAARFLLAEGVQTAVIKLGAEGCLVMNAGEEFICPAFPVDAADTTGAGDCFVAGFLTGLLRGWPLRECARFACAAAALCVTQIGATSGVRSFSEAMSFLKSYQ